MKLDIVGASNFVNRMFEACGNYQWAREFLKNSLEAKATKVEFGIEWQAVERLGVYRRTIIDDGVGMSRDQLHKFFRTLGEGDKKIGGIHDNFGVGAKIAALPWNPDGMVVVSYKDGHASMIEIVLEPESGEYELIEFQTSDGNACVIDPTSIDWQRSDEGIDYGALRPDWLLAHGTIVVLKGSELQPDSVLGNPQAGEQAIKGLSVYLNSRFWDLSKCEVRVVELRSEKKNSWPQSADDRDETRRPNNRTILGARHYLKDVKASNGKLDASDIVLLDEDRVIAEWYLWSGERPHIDSYARKGGYVGVLYNDELFELTSGKVQFRAFGVVESKVQQNLSIILIPQHYTPETGRWGVHPDQSRNRLIFTGDGEKGVAMPFSEWGLEFAENLPQPIRDAIDAARGETSGSIDDDEYRKRLQDKFGSRWGAKILVKPHQPPIRPKPVTVADEETEVLELIPGVRSRVRHKRRKTVKVLLKKATAGGDEDGVEREVEVDVPHYRYAGKEDFEKPWHLACWAPNDPAGPTVLMNREAPVLDEVTRYHQNQYPDIYAEEVATTVRNVFGEVAVAKVAHSQKLVREVAEELLDSEYRSEAALTVALMGLLAEESLIAQRLGRLGKKKAAA
jgi:hypothetical protein